MPRDLRLSTENVFSKKNTVKLAYLMAFFLALMKKVDF